MKNKSIMFLLGIVLLAGFLRFFQLGTNPPSLNWDEAAWGYNAYALGIDGRDEFGRFLPFDYLESFGDFKPPLYAYLSILPVKLLGLTPFAIRFVSALFGTAFVFLTYFLVLKLFPAQNEHTQRTQKFLALTAPFFLAVSPWHIMLSRAGFEANVASCLIGLGVLCFFIGKDGRSIGYILSAVSFALSFYTFNSPRIVAPLLVLLLVASFAKTVWKHKKQVILAGIVGLVVVLPLTPFLFSPQASLRFHEVNIFSQETLVQTANQEIANDQNSFWSKILHNRRFVYMGEFLTHYFDNLSPQFLFISGDENPRFSIQDVGQLYLFELPFFVAGILLLKRKTKYWFVIFLWLLLAIIPAGVARETPHALRIQNALPTFQILTAVGVVSMVLFLRKKSKGIQYIVFGFGGLILLSNILYFLHSYSAHYKKAYSAEWQYGYKEAIEKATARESEFDEVRMSTTLGRPYIFVLLHKKIHPSVFRTQSTVKRDAFGFVTVENVGKYYFSENLQSKAVADSEKVLYIDHPVNVPPQARKIDSVTQLNGEEVFVFYTM